MEELDTSELGTKAYWDNHYKLERVNFSDHGDKGDVWFGEECGRRICAWIIKTNIITPNTNILDLGCGNGDFLMSLKKKGYNCLYGVDYSPEAICLAQEIAKKENALIEYKVLDILNDEFDRKYDIVHDKGTYDAVSLSPDSKKNRKTYIDKVYNIIEDHGFFIITSCNWVQSELQETHFKDKFYLHYVIPTPQFTFGGYSGNSVTSLVFKKMLQV